MIEEAAGTRMYECKKISAQKTIEKKEAKLKEICMVIDFCNGSLLFVWFILLLCQSRVAAKVSQSRRNSLREIHSGSVISPLFLKT